MGSFLEKILAERATYRYKPKKKIMFYCNTIWPLNNLLNYCTIFQIEIGVSEVKYVEEILYVHIFIQLHDKESEQPETKLMVQWCKKALPLICKDIRTPEERV